MSIYNGLSGKESNMEASYGLLDMASQVALRVFPSPLFICSQTKELYCRRDYVRDVMVSLLFLELITGNRYRPLDVAF